MTDAVVFQRRSSAGPACAGVEDAPEPRKEEAARRPRVRGGRGFGDDVDDIIKEPAPRARG